MTIQEILLQCYKKLLVILLTIQNEQIDVIGINTIQQDLINETKNDGFFSILADEVTASHDEILSIRFRYVHSNKDIRGVFLQLLDLERITDSFIDQAIINILERKNITIMNCRGQCNDAESIIFRIRSFHYLL